MSPQLTFDFGNENILSSVREYRLKWLHDIQVLYPIFFRPCRVKVLLVADGGLDFSPGNFGLSTFLEILHTPPGPYVKFDITVGHRSTFANDTMVAMGNPAVVRSIKGIRFDNPDHFTPTMYDQVWLFGIITSIPTKAQPSPSDWTNRPTDAELRNISEFMDKGGGLFVTGDHGALGSALCGHIPRARSMRLWFAQTGPYGNPVAPDMNSPQRNDTNRPGANGVFDFDDQSDDIPQEIIPKYYTKKISIWKRIRWPHPLLCGPKGVIKVLPDHPHEGECVAPYEFNRSFTFNGYTSKEYPNALEGGGQIVPEVVAFSTVLPGNNVKDPTVAQTFGAISAYDGELAGVGRVVADATWHHFVNINLIGYPGAADPVKTQGFLASPAGQKHFEEIKAYYRNIAVWISPTAKRRCMRRHVIWYLLWDHRLLEAVSAGTPLKLRGSSIDLILSVGRHARDAMGKFAGRCQTEVWLLDYLKWLLPQRIFEILNPWDIPKFDKRREIPLPEPDPVPWFDPDPIMDIALGGGIIALREEFPEANPAVVTKAENSLDDILLSGSQRAMQQSIGTIDLSIKGAESLRNHLITIGKTEKPKRRKGK